jgi:DNA polymerase (family 10)
MAIAMERARALAADLAGALRVAGAAAVVPVGGVRRGTAARVKDIDLLVVLRGAVPAAAAAVAAPAPYELRVLTAGPRRQTLCVKAPWRGAARGYRWVRVDLFFATRAERPYALFHHTGSKAYNVRVRAHAKARGLRLNQYGLFVAATGRPAPGPPVRTERALADRLGVTYRPPSQRQ